MFNGVLVCYYKNWFPYEIAIRVKPGKGEEFMASLKGDDLEFGNVYASNIRSIEKRKDEAHLDIHNLLRNLTACAAFVMIAVFLGFLGSFWYRTQQRVPEIALRKVNGATNTDLFRRLISEGLVLLGVASVIILGTAAVLIPQVDIAGSIGFEVPKILLWGMVVVTLGVLALMIVGGIWLPARKAMKSTRQKHLKTNETFFIAIIVILLALCVFAQGGREMTLPLDEAIAMARVRSVDAAEALDELRSAYWEWRTFRADQLPEFTFKATAPSYAKQYSSYMDGDGNYSFVGTNTLQATGQLSVTQNIPLTGGKIAVNSSLDFLRQFDGGVGNRFMSIPVALTLSQPLFSANTMKWDRKIEPVRYSEAKAAFLSATENVARRTVDYYFTLLMNRENLEIARQNLENAEKLYAVAQEKREMGKISQNDLLQMELNVLDARSAMTETQSELKASMFTLRAFLDLEEDVEIVPEVPETYRWPISAMRMPLTER